MNHNPHPQPQELLWAVRAFIYRNFAETAHPPTLREVVDHFGLGLGETEEIYRELDRLHAFFLEPGTLDIRIANPFSAVPTAFPVEANGKRYWANCGWDALGIPAALHADARITAACAFTGEPIHLEVRGDQLLPTTAVIHFVVSVSRWYEDMIFT